MRQKRILCNVLQGERCILWCHVGMHVTHVYHNLLIHIYVLCQVMENVFHPYVFQGVIDDTRFLMKIVV